MIPIAIVIFPILAILCAPAIWCVLGRPHRLPLPQKSESKPSKPIRISIIIPARNEEENIGKLLKTINHQSQPPYEVIVVNDGSSDQTASVAEQLGARVINAAPLPDGWNGKPWACQQGAGAATGQWFLFLDADLALEKRTISTLAGLCDQPDKVYSVCPHHGIEKTYEELSVFFNILMLAGVNAFGPEKQATNNSALFGQCMLISRDHYQSVGGHAEVKDKVLENFYLANRLKALGITRSCFLGKGFITMRMFPHGIGELWAGWKKGFASGAANTPRYALVASSIWISSLMLTLVSAALTLTPYASAPFMILAATAYLIHVGQCLYAFKSAGTFSVWNAVFFPLSLLFYLTLFFYSILDQKRGKTTQWKGRAVS
ncbi:MAG: glycosyltransferase [Verrucomicrobiae bacterium]|nr:glycosyltransferase [Verrucomicrobiae bacterium]NNJ41852.1 glycosyltransferase [Akkermansiaceae bacterium]